MNISSFLIGYLAGKKPSGGGSSDDVRYVIFMSYDGSEEYGKIPVAVGYDCPNPKFDTPKKESDVQYNYTFAGWSTEVNGGLDANALKAVEEDRTVYANFAAVTRYYTVTYYDEDGTTVLNSQKVTYGADASYRPEKEGYKFIGWSEDVTNVTADMDVYATWEIDDGYIHDSWETVVERAKNGTAEQYYKSGNKIALPLTYADGTTETVDLYLTAFNSGLAEDGSTANVAFFCANALQELCAYSTSSLSYSNAATKYADCELVKHLEDDVFTAMPTVLQNNIIARERQSTMDFTAGRKLWHAYDNDLTEPIMYAEKSVKIYQVLPDAASRIMYQKGGNTPVEYWAGNLVGEYNYYFAKIINTAGNGPTKKSENPPSTKRGVVFGFLI